MVRKGESGVEGRSDDLDGKKLAAKSQKVSSRSFPTGVRVHKLFVHHAYDGGCLVKMQS